MAEEKPAGASAAPQFSNEKLASIFDKMNKNTGGGRDHAGAVADADQLVQDHPEWFAQLRNMTVHECVQAVEVFRNAGLVEDQWKVEAWLLHHFKPLNIGGAFQAEVRIPPGL